MTRSFFTKATTVATVAFATATMASVAQAQNTVLNFGGTVQVRDPNGASDPIGGQLNIDFLPISLPFPGSGNINVSTDPFADNDLVGVAPGQAGTIQDLIATPTGLASYPSNFLQLGAYTFSLNAVETGGVFGPIFLTQTGSSVTATFNVSGRVSGGAFGDGRGRYAGTFTAQFPRTTIAGLVNSIDAGGSARNSFSATFQIATIPEPSTYVLMASGVAMLGAFARRRRQQA